MDDLLPPGKPTQRWTAWKKEISKAPRNRDYKAVGPEPLFLHHRYGDKCGWGSGSLEERQLLEHFAECFSKPRENQLWCEPFEGRVSGTGPKVPAYAHPQDLRFVYPQGSWTLEDSSARQASHAQV